MKLAAKSLIWALALTSAVLWFGGAWYLNNKARDNLFFDTRDAQLAAEWEATHGTSGQVNVTVLDACADIPQKVERYKHSWLIKKDAVARYTVACALAIRGALRFYGDLGGTYGCTQVRRALSLYPNLGDELSLKAAAACVK